jgi:hypothetical protein
MTLMTAGGRVMRLAGIASRTSVATASWTKSSIITDSFWLMPATPDLGPVKKSSSARIKR